MGTQEGERVSLKHFRFSQGREGEIKQTPKPDSATKAPPQTKESPKPQPQKQPAKTTKPKPAQSKQPTRQIPQSSNQSLAQSLAKPPSQSNAPQSPSIYDFGKDMSNQEIKDLYGEEFGSLDAEQRQFIKDNLNGIGRITQKYLKYPVIAGKMGQQGDNIVEFYLYPNGDISDLKLLTPSGFTLLDDNSVRTIRIAYKDYPYPSVKTKIRIRVMYRIY